MIFSRQLILLLAFSAMVFAQSFTGSMRIGPETMQNPVDMQNSVNFRIYSSSFPEDCVFKLELGLRYFVIDANKMMSEGRKTPTSEDYLTEQLSINSFDWTISYDSNKSPVIKSSPESVIFNFKNPIKKLSNAPSFLHLHGNGTLSKNGENSNVILVQTISYRPNTTYVLMLDYIETTKNGNIGYSVALMTEEELKSRLENKFKPKSLKPIGQRP